MPSPRKRRVERAQIGAYVLQPAGLTNVASGDATNPVSIGYLQADALYSAEGITPTFTEGSQTLLSDAVSNADGLWTAISAAYLGEATANSLGFVPSNVIHRYFPYPGAGNTTQTDQSAVVIYSKDGPQGKYNPAYLPTAAQTVGTGSLTFIATNISKSAGTLPRLIVWVAGTVPTGAVGSTITVLTGASFNTTALTFTASSTVFAASASMPTASIGTGVRVVFSSSANTYNLNTYNNGFMVYITGSN